MKILLINPATINYARAFTCPLGLLSIATHLNNNGHTAEIFDRTIAKGDLDEKLSQFRPDIVGISLMSNKSIDDALFVARKVKEHSLTVVCGGPFASSVPELVLREDCFDYISVSEGEFTWLEIADNLNGGKPFEQIAGLAYMENGKVIYTPEREFANPALLPVIDYSLVDVKQYFQVNYKCKKMLYVYWAKGCPCRCAFCYNAEFHRRCYRKRPIESVIAEIRCLVGEHGADGIYFADELFCRNRKEMHEICDTLRSLDLDFVWGCQTRIGIFNEEDFKYMYDSGCRWIFFGIESGSEKMLENMHKDIRLDKVAETFEGCNKAGLIAISSFIIGLPDETPEDLMQTLDLVKGIKSKLFNVNYLAIIPGSEFYYKAIESGKLPRPQRLSEFRDQRFGEILECNLSNIPYKDLKVLRAFFMWLSFTAKGYAPDGEKSNSFAVKVIKDALDSTRKHGIGYFFKEAYYSGTEFLKVVFNITFYPSVKKKYNLKFKYFR